MHAATANALFHTVVLPDDDALFNRPDAGTGTAPSEDHDEFYAHTSGVGPASALVRNVARYGPRVHTLLVVDPTYPHAPKRENTLFELESHAEEEGGDQPLESDGIRPMSAAHLEMLLRECTALEELAWVASVPPPDGICEASIHPLTHFLTSTRVQTHVHD